MYTVTQMAKAAHVSVRTLRYYDKVGLLPPTCVTGAGYRQYDDSALERLYLILVFRELGFPLGRIRALLDAPDFDRNRVLEEQIRLLEKKRAHLQNCIHLARGIKMMGVKYLEFENFDVNKLDDYSAQAETLYGKTDAWNQWQEKRARRTPEKDRNINSQVMDFFVRLGTLRDQDPAAEAAQAWVTELHSFFTENFYDCTPQILKGLGELYAGGGSMTENIDAAGGPGTGAFAKAAIDAYCSNLQT